MEISWTLLTPITAQLSPWHVICTGVLPFKLSVFLVYMKEKHQIDGFVKRIEPWALDLQRRDISHSHRFCTSVLPMCDLFLKTRI
jgi:hypothetical protein